MILCALPTHLTLLISYCRHGLCFPERHVAEIIQYMVFSDWLLKFPFLLDADSIAWMDHSLSIQLLKDILGTSKFGQLGMKLL